MAKTIYDLYMQLLFSGWEWQHAELVANIAVTITIALALFFVFGIFIWIYRLAFGKKGGWSKWL